MGKGIFGSMFDINRDGNLDVIERAAELAFLEELEQQDDPLAYESEDDNLFDDLDNWDD